MSNEPKHKKWLTTDYPEIIFEDNEIGRMKKKIFDASDKEIAEILEEYEIPSESELGKPGCYIQNTPRAIAVEKRRKNDIVFIPIGCTENHGDHANSGLDTFMVTQICEGVRRYTAKQGREVNLAFSPINYGGHPYHHVGMPGTVIIPRALMDVGGRDTGIHEALLPACHRTGCGMAPLCEGIFYANRPQRQLEHQLHTCR